MLGKIIKNHASNMSKKYASFKDSLIIRFERLFNNRRI